MGFCSVVQSCLLIKLLKQASASPAPSVCPKSPSVISSLHCLHILPACLFFSVFSFLYLAFLKFLLHLLKPGFQSPTQNSHIYSFSCFLQFPQSTVQAQLSMLQLSFSQQNPRLKEPLQFQPAPRPPFSLCARRAWACHVHRQSTAERLSSCSPPQRQ